MGKWRKGKINCNEIVDRGVERKVVGEDRERN